MSARAADWPVWPLHLAAAVMIGVLVGGAGLWAWAARIDSALPLSGQWSGSAPPQEIKAPVTARVVQLLVRDGQEVAAGAPLVILDSADLAEEAALIALQRRDLALRRLRLEAQEAGLWPVQTPFAANDPALAAERALFAAWQQARAAQETDSRLRADQLQAEIAGLTAQSAAQRQRRALLDTAIATQTALRDAGLAQAQALRALEDDSAALSGEEAAVTAGLARAESQLAAVANDLARARASAALDTAAGLQEIAQRAALLEARAAALDRLIAAQTLRAPVAGRAEGVSTTQGSLLLAGQTALTLAPPLRDAHLRAALPVQSAESLVLGQSVQVVLPTADLRDIPPLTGSLSRISDLPRALPDGGGPAYEVEIRLAPEELARLPPHAAPRMGAPVQLYILTGSHPPLLWLLAPLSGYFTKVFRES